MISHLGSDLSHVLVVVYLTSLHTPQSDIADLGRKLTAAHTELAQCEERWLELAE